MSDQIETSYVKAYKAGFEHEFQQKMSRLRPYVRQEPFTSAEFQFFDRLGVADDVNEVLTRYGDTPLNEVSHDRRRVAMRDWDWAKLVDRKDLYRVLTDPSTEYTQAAVMSFNRKMDDVLIGAFDGDVYTGKEGNTTVSFVSEVADSVATGNGTTTEGTVISDTYDGLSAAAAKNLTIEKLLAAKESLLSNEYLDDGEELYIVVTANQLFTMLQREDVKSADYNTVKALAAGQLNDAWGFKFIRCERLPKSGDVRSCFAFTRKSMLLSVAKELTIDVGPRRDKRNIPQIYINMSFNATRMWGEQVVKILCDETKAAD